MKPLFRFHVASPLPDDMIPIMHRKRLPLLRMISFSATLLLVACTTPPVTPPSTGKLPHIVGEHSDSRGYARVIQTQPDTFIMQTGSRIFRRAGSPDIDLVGAIHVAERSYYQQLQSRLDQSSLVLFEGVSSRKSDTQLPKRDGKGAYARFAHALGLISQDEGIDYSRKHFVRCDLSAEEMVEILNAEIARGGKTAEEAETAKRELANLGKILGGKSWLMNFAIQIVNITPSLRERVRLSTISTGLGDQQDSPISPRLQRMILQDRNAYVEKELRQRASSSQRRIAVFYGAAHLHELEARLKKMGYNPAGGSTWMNSISSHPYAAGITPEEVRETFGK